MFIFKFTFKNNHNKPLYVTHITYLYKINYILNAMWYPRLDSRTKKGH